MSAVIKVVKPDAPVRAISDEERHIVFNRLALESKIFDSYHFKNFAEQEGSIIKEQNDAEISPILSIFARNVIKHPYIFPIWKTDFRILKSDRLRFGRANPEELADEIDTGEYADSDDEPPLDITVGVDISDDMKYGGRDKTKKKSAKPVKPVKSKKPQKPQKSIKSKQKDSVPPEGPSLLELAEKAKQKSAVDEDVFSFPVQLESNKKVFAYTDDVEKSTENPTDLDIQNWTMFQLAQDKDFEICGL